MALKQRVNSGFDVETASDILESLDANPTAGTANAAVDLGGRKDEPTKDAAAKPYAGIDSLYDREYEYDESGAWTAMLLRQFFQLGEGHRVSASALRDLWKQGEPALTLQPTRLQPGGGGEARAVCAKTKPSEESAAAQQLQNRARRNLREQKQLCAKLAKAAAEAAAVAAATSHRCSHVGCRHRPFLSKAGLTQHEAHFCPFRPSVQAVQSVQACRVEARRCA